LPSSAKNNYLPQKSIEASAQKGEKLVALALPLETTNKPGKVQDQMLCHLRVTTLMDNLELMPTARSL
jgi:hypothetical protein